MGVVATFWDQGCRDWGTKKKTSATMSLSTLNTEAVALLQMGRPDEGVSLLLQAFDRLDLLAASESNEEDNTLAASTSTSQKLASARSILTRALILPSRQQLPRMRAADTKQQSAEPQKHIPSWQNPAPCSPKVTTSTRSLLC